MPANLLALGAITLWASLASLGVALAHVPPLLLTGLALLVGSVPAWPRWRQWRVPARVLALGVCGLFGYHFLLFMALRLAPAVEANLVNYLWPLFIVVLAPLFVPALRLRARHVAAALAGLAGAGFAILGAAGDAAPATGATAAGGTRAWLGYGLAFGSACIWATYSLMTRRLSERGSGFPTAAIGAFCAASGVLALICHALLEPRVALGAREFTLIAALGLGPLGAAFYLWDAALKRGDPRALGVLGYATPVASTLVLMLVTGRAWSWQIAVAVALILGAAMAAMRGD